MIHFASQLRLSARSLARSPGFTAVTVLTLAVGIAAVTAVFAVLERVVLRPLPYPDSDRLVSIRSVIPGQNPDEVWGLSEAGYFRFAEQSRTIEAIGAADNVFIDVKLTLSGRDGAVRVAGDSVTASMLEVLGARASHGRLFDERDDRPGAPLVLVLSHEVWTAYFGADPSIVGRTIRVDGSAREVIGVMEPGFRLPGQTAGAWVPLRLDPSRRPVNDHILGGIARLRPDATIEAVRAELGDLTSRFPEVFPTAYTADWMERWGFATRVQPLREAVIGDVARVLWTLLGGVGLVLLIALANVANMFLLRTEVRRGELAIRTAHGASRWRLGAEGLGESVVVAAAAAGSGLLAASYALDILVLASPAAIPRLSEVALGWSGIAAGIGIALVAAMIVGPLPRLWARVDLTALREGGAGQMVSARRQLFRRMLVGAQVALALMLLAGAGLMLRSFDRLSGQEMGFDQRNLLTFQVALPAVRYGDPSLSARFYRDLGERLLAMPGVIDAGAVTELPFGTADGCWQTHSDDRPVAPDEPAPCVRVLAATPGYMGVLGMSIEGEIPGWADLEAGTDGVVVTRALADRFWPGQAPIGKTIRGFAWGDAPHYRVIGVAADIRSAGVDRAPLEAVFLPILPLPGAPLHWGPFWGGERELHMVVRASGSPESLAPAIRDLLRGMDADVAPGEFRTMTTLVGRSESVARTSLLMVLLGVAAVIAVFLSAVGLYGVVSYFVRQRTREIGLRMALGADVRIVTASVLRQAVAVALAGVAVGLTGALGLTRILRSLLFEVHPNDPLTLAAAAIVLV
ncbi:MAG TPA: ADOP family duplicated permease, partial [Longimicrobiales bacterium]|nr:ADOP family duplicated permease [Longimicrobiales bacterium]